MSATSPEGGAVAGSIQEPPRPARPAPTKRNARSAAGARKKTTHPASSSASSSTLPRPAPDPSMQYVSLVDLGKIRAVSAAAIKSRFREEKTAEDRENMKKWQRLKAVCERHGAIFIENRPERELIRKGAWLSNKWRAELGTPTKRDPYAEWLALAEEEEVNTRRDPNAETREEKEEEEEGAEIHTEEEEVEEEAETHTPGAMRRVVGISKKTKPARGSSSSARIPPRPRDSSAQYVSLVDLGKIRAVSAAAIRSRCREEKTAEDRENMKRWARLKAVCERYGAIFVETGLEKDLKRKGAFLKNGWYAELGTPTRQDPYAEWLAEEEEVGDRSLRGDQGSVPECGVVSGGIDVWFRDGWQVEGLCDGGVVSCWLL